MKRLVKLSMCFLLMLGVSGIQGVSAEEPTTYTGDAEEEFKIYPEDIVMSTTENDSNTQIARVTHDTLTPISTNEMLHMVFPNDKIKIDDFNIKTNLSNPEIFDLDTVNNLTFREMFGNCKSTPINRIALSELLPIKEGTSTLQVMMINKQDPSIIYYGKAIIEVTDKYKGAQLVIDQNEFTISLNDLIYYEGTNEPYVEMNKEHAVYNNVIQPLVLKVGLKDNQGRIYLQESETFNIRISNEEIINYGLTGSPIDGNYVSTNNKQREDGVFKNNHEQGVCSFGGFGGTGDEPLAFAITPKAVGTTYITFSYGAQKVTVKVNVTNLSDEPSESLPNDLANEFYSDANEKINVNLTKPNTVGSDIFTSAKETGKDVTFNVLSENNKELYSWTFNGTTITNPNIDLDLSLLFTSDKQKEIQTITGQSNVFYLTFAHHGELPGTAKMKVDVSSQYKDGNEIYLYYYNEEANAVEQTGDKVIVKDGYAEFEISHCSTYFFTSEPIETGDKVEPTTPSTDNNVKSDEKEEVKEKAAVKKDSNAIKDTGLDTATTTKGIAISILAFAILAYVVIAKRKKA